MRMRVKIDASTASPLADASRAHDVDSKMYGTSLLKGLQVLRSFTPDAHERGITELAHFLGLAKSTVLRIVRSLEAEGFVGRVPDSGKYRLGLVLWSLGNLAFERSKGLAEFARPYLNELVELTKESAQTVIIDGFECVRLDKIEAPQAVRAYMSVGGRFPAYVSAAGQVLLAYQPAATTASLVKHGLHAHTRRTLTTRAELEGRLTQVRRQGYSVSEGEYRDDVGGFGAPIRDGTGAVVGALGISIPMSRFPIGARAGRAIQALMDVTTRLSRDLGYIAIDSEPRNRAAQPKRRADSKARAPG
jgi:IclR family transcriptional regulator, KDG regulon repressor